MTASGHVRGGDGGGGGRVGGSVAAHVRDRCQEQDSTSTQGEHAMLLLPQRQLLREAVGRLGGLCSTQLGKWLNL